MGVFVSIDTTGLEAAFQRLPSRVNAGVKITGDATQYALVWEWGSIRITKPGPKTQWGVNPDGEVRIMTITAPQGWIRVNKDKYRAIFLDELTRAQVFTKFPASQWQTQLQLILGYTSDRCASLMSDTAPYDTGLLSSSLIRVGDGDPILSDDGSSFMVDLF